MDQPIDPRKGLKDPKEIAKLDPSLPIPPNLLTKEDKDRDQATLARAIAAGARPQDQVYVGGMPNAGFEAVPWTPRPEMNRNVGKWTPSHLHWFTDDEKKAEHYPKATKIRGEFAFFCWACGRPTQKNGVTGKGHAGHGKPCPACGFRRKMRHAKGQIDALKSAAPGQAVVDMYPEQKAAREARTALLPAPLKKRNNNITEMMRERALGRADAVMEPYFKALDLEAKDDWSPSTKLEFYMNQTQVAEKLLNRADGMPVARTRHVDKNDEDVLRDDELSPSTLVQLVAAIATGANIDELLAIEDAEFEVIENDD